jgi:hypothetical protein
MEKPASEILETTMLRLHFSPKLKTLVRGVYELFPHMAETLVDDIVRHQLHTGNLPLELQKRIDGFKLEEIEEVREAFAISHRHALFVIQTIEADHHVEDVVGVPFTQNLVRRLNGPKDHKP